MDSIARHHGLPLEVLLGVAQDHAESEDDDDDDNLSEMDEDEDHQQDRDELGDQNADTDAAERVFQEALAKNRDVQQFDERCAEWNTQKEQRAQERARIEAQTGYSMATATEPPEPDVGRKNIYTTAPGSIVLVWQPEPGRGFIGSKTVTLQLLDTYKTDELFQQGLVAPLDRHPYVGHSGRLADPTYQRRKGAHQYDWCCGTGEDIRTSQLVGDTFDRECLEQVGERIVQTRGVTVITSARNRDWMKAALADGTWLAQEQERGAVSIVEMTRQISSPNGGEDPIDIPAWIIRSRTAHERETRTPNIDGDDVPVTHLVEFTCHPSYGYYAHGLKAQRALYALDVVLYELATSLGVHLNEIKFGTFSTFARTELTGSVKRHRLSQWARLERAERAPRGGDFSFPLAYLETVDEDDLVDLVIQLNAEYEADDRVRGAYPPDFNSRLQCALSASRFQRSKQLRASRIGPLQLSHVYRDLGTAAKDDHSVMLTSDGAPLSIRSPNGPVARTNLPLIGPHGGVAILSDGSPLSTLGSIRADMGVLNQRLGQAGLEVNYSRWAMRDYSLMVSKVRAMQHGLVTSYSSLVSMEKYEPRAVEIIKQELQDTLANKLFNKVRRSASPSRSSPG
ncbi:hypothetical protein JCM3770_001266 [Rhodotorula araucariae]